MNLKKLLPVILMLLAASAFGSTRSQVFTYACGGTGTLGSPNFEQINSFNGTIGEGSGVCAPSAVNHLAVRVINQTFSANQYAKATITGFSFISTDYYAGVIVRASGSPNVDSSRNYYFLYACANSGGPYQTVLGKVVNGTVTALNTANIAWANGDTISLEIDGTTLTAYRNDIALGGAWTQTGQTDLTTGNPGMIASGSGVLTLDNLDTGDMVAGGGGVVTNPLSGKGGAAARPLIGFRLPAANDDHFHTPLRASR